MDFSQAKEKNAPQNEKKSADPFASDIFAVPRVEENFAPEITPAGEIKNSPNRIWRLPKAARTAVDWDELRRDLPPDFSADLPRMLAGALAKYLNLGEDNPVEFLFLIEDETNGVIESGEHSWWLNIGIETSEAGFAIEINDVLAVWLVDAALGEKEFDTVKVRELMPSEIAVLEFLAVNLTHEANEIINAPLFSFRGLSRKNPDRINQTNDSEKSLLAASWQTVHGWLHSIVKIYVAPETLNALRADENQLLTAAPRRAVRWKALQNRVRDVRARMFLGEVRLSLADLAGLETGDVVLPEKYNLAIAGGDLVGGAEIFLGDGEQSKIGGALVSSAVEPPVEFEETGGGGNNEVLVRRINSNQILRIAVERFEESDVPPSLEKSMSNETNDLTEQFPDLAAGGGIALENLAVTLRVELEGRRLTLAEVGNLRINQIIELGASAADPVNLVIDNRVVARGELVEIEARLGVRIIQILR